MRSRQRLGGAQTGSSDKDEQEAIRLGIVQVMMLVSPFMRDEERLHLNNLSKAYLK